MAKLKGKELLDAQQEWDEKYAEWEDDYPTYEDMLKATYYGESPDIQFDDRTIEEFNKDLHENNGK